MILPRSLSWQEDRPPRTEWRCVLHGDLKPGESTCSKCCPDEVESS